MAKYILCILSPLRFISHVCSRNHKQLHGSYVFQGKLSLRLRRDSKKLFAVQKVLRENNFFFLTPKILQGVSSMSSVLCERFEFKSELSVQSQVRGARTMEVAMPGLLAS